MTATRAGSPKPARSGADRMGDPRRLGRRPRRLADGATIAAAAEPFRHRRRPLDRHRARRRRPLLGGPRRHRRRPSRARPGAAPDRGAAERDLLRPARPERARHPPARPPTLDAFTAEDWRALSDLRNVRTAIALAEIGETGLAGDVLRHQARIGQPQPSTRRCSTSPPGSTSPATQMWLAHNGPRGTRTDTHDRYPTPELAAGARLAGRPGAGLRPRAPGIELPARRGEPGRRARADAGPARHRRRPDPRARRSRPIRTACYRAGHQHGVRPVLSRISARPAGDRRAAARVIAAYNAGPAPIAEWNARFDQSDPLLFIEIDPLLGDARLRADRAPQLLDLRGARRRPLAEPPRPRRRPVAALPGPVRAERGADRARRSTDHRRGTGLTPGLRRARWTGSRYRPAAGGAMPG